jgi:hypothetical protein
MIEQNGREFRGWGVGRMLGYEPSRPISRTKLIVAWLLVCVMLTAVPIGTPLLIPTPTPTVVAPTPTVVLTPISTPPALPTPYPNEDATVLFLIDAVVLEFDGVYVAVWSDSSQMWVGDNIINAVAKTFELWEGQSQTMYEDFWIMVVEATRPIGLAVRVLNGVTWGDLTFDPVMFPIMNEGDMHTFRVTMTSSSPTTLGPQETLRFEIYEP